MLQANTSSLLQISELGLIGPELILSVAACAALVLEVLLPRERRRSVAYFAVAMIGLSAVSVLAVATTAAGSFRFWSDGFSVTTAFYGMVRIDGIAICFKLVVLTAAALTIALSGRYFDASNEQSSEYYALILFATTGMMFLVSAGDLISLYVSLELMAIAFYVLVAYTKQDKLSNEAALKYFLLGAFSSAILLYGMSLLYGISGSTSIVDIATSVRQTIAAFPVNDQTLVQNPAPTLRPLLLLATVTLSVGLFFKIGAAPFHMWVPDVYEGAPTPVTAFLSTASKAASFVLFARIFLIGLIDFHHAWAPLLGLVAAITIFVGNWGAVTQLNAKRLLAYSSISNAGYLLLGSVAANDYGYYGLLIYLLVYTLMNAGAFGIIISLRRRGFAGDNVEDFSGLGQRAPGLAFMMTVFMLSLGGLPATGGFIGKWYLFGGLIARGHEDATKWYYWLAAWAAINTVISFYYYLRFVRAMYLNKAVAGYETLTVSRGLRAALIVATVCVVALGIFPRPVIEFVAALVR